MTPEYITRTEKVFPSLTKGMKKVAEALLHDPYSFVIHPAKQIGSITGVSETMVIRFCKALGYDGFSQLQETLKQEMLKFDSPIPLDDYVPTPFTTNIRGDLDLIESNLQQLNTSELSSVVERIIKSERVIVVGYYQSNAFAYWLFFNLNYITGNAHLYRPETDARLLDLTPPNSCVIVFSFYRYAMDTIRFVKEAKNKGITVIVITDSHVSPVVQYADHIVLIRLGRASLLRKGPVTLSVINSILAEAANQIEEKGVTPASYKYFIKDGEEKNDHYDFD
ncbi:MurR/RpiR family transcriptional regulator [Edaphobacillus lindanitolerans]|uniref:Transcriptional regulator, RpiR family n=1 Tax=Edaphobacillus lindanitolerans TaxID=550447 RepID=A0A1U7PMV9_9BACI|nr:MurR/RpiR family transcriptional regulator [Edaphobacillus lindanitolerans]SIT72651.1 transcriptional regulator, RpiR family [Edaphobacillus lindanitolerans]